jgi:hypothetical protein
MREGDICIYTYIHTYICIYICVCVCMYVCISCMCVPYFANVSQLPTLHTRVHTCIDTHKHIHTTHTRRVVKFWNSQGEPLNSLPKFVGGATSVAWVVNKVCMYVYLCVHLYVLGS